VTKAKIGLVTGAGKRIGKAIAEKLLLRDYRLILHANSSVADLKTWVNSSDKKHHVIDIIAADLSISQGQDFLVSKVNESINTLDLVVHNASAFAPKKFCDISRFEFQEMMAINLEAPFFITQGLLKLLLRSQDASVINILDAMWMRPRPQFCHYAISKAGLAILTRALACELAPDIRVNAVAPGLILFQPFHSDEMRAQIIESIPKKSLGEPDDIAQAVLYLSEAHYTTGEILVIDGGRSIAP
jgi:pteridine reductase